MNQFDFVFEPSHWEDTLNAIKDRDTFSAMRFLTLMEEESEEAWEDAWSLLEAKKISLDVSDLPRPAISGEMAVRLRREEQLVQQGNLLEALEEQDPLRLYLEEIAEIPAYGDPKVLAEACAQGDEDAMAQLANLMLSQVVAEAFAQTGKGVLLLDLIQEGSLGLWNGLLSYQGGDIEVLCRGEIARAMAKVILEQARENGVGQRMRQALEDYRAVDERLLGELGRNPTREEMAVELHLTPEETETVGKMLENARQMRKVKPEEEQPEEDPDDLQAVENTAYFQARQRISELLSCLPEQDAKLLTLRFGLEGGMPCTPEETGRKLGLTPEEVVQRETAALAKLRQNG